MILTKKAYICNGIKYSGYPKTVQSRKNDYQKQNYVVESNYIRFSGSGTLLHFA